MSTLNPFAADIAAVAEQENHTVASAGFEREIAPEGITLCRLVGVTELGVHDGGEYQGKKKADVEYARFVFELLGPKNIKTVVKEDGTSVTFGQLVSIKVKKTQSDKGKYLKLFKKLLYGRNHATIPAQLLGEAFLVTVRHGKSADGKTTYVNLDSDDGSYTFQAPVQHDVAAGTTTQISVPAPTVPLQCFLWNNPSLEMWKSIFIDGEREVKTKDAQGNEVVTMKSRNWIQETILSAKNFPGSPLYVLLSGVAGLPMAGNTSGAEAMAEAQMVSPAAPAVQTQPASTADALAALAAAGIKVDLDDEIPF